MERTLDIRNHVVKEAARLFGRYGYATTSIDLVVRELRLSDVPDYFDDFEMLAKAAFDYGVERSERVLDEAVHAQDGVLNQLAGLIGGFRGLVEYPPADGGCPVFGFSPNVPGAFPFLRSSAQQAVSRWRHRIRRLVRTGIRNGEIHPGADPEGVSSIFLNTLEGAVVMYLLYEDVSHLDRAQAHLSNYLSEIAA
jgi:AcrR family transcriptional regulator